MGGIGRSVFIHFFNDQMYRNYNLEKRFDVEQLAEQAVLALKVAYLLTDSNLILPMSDVVESKSLQLSLNAVKPIVDEGTLTLSGTSGRFEDLVEKKARQYERVRIYPQYFESPAARGMERATWTPRLRSSTSDVAAGWERRIEEFLSNGDQVASGRRAAGGLAASAWSASTGNLTISEFGDEALALADRLDGDAFLWDIVRSRKLLSIDASPGVDLPLRMALAQDWLLSYLFEYDALILSDFPRLGPLDCGLSTSHRDRVLSLRSALMHLKSLGLERLVELDFSELQAIKAEYAFAVFRNRLWWPRLGFAEAPTLRLTLVDLPVGSMESGAGVGSEGFVLARRRLNAWYEKLADLDKITGAEIKSLRLDVGDIRSGEGGITVNAGGDGGFSGSISINTGAISQSPGAINLGGDVQVWQSSMRLIQKSMPELASLLTDLRVALAGAEGLTGAERAEGVEAVSDIVLAMSNEVVVAGEGGELESRVERLSELAARSGVAAGGLAALVEALRTTLGF